ncbi:MAG TPA: hypothetical protein RMH99_13465 [Sandaracinaceae bacterium LLY-WYZ-13_1]|nr:hypothetical protein [Sandaracinaceae bacterium LLY-WYZ-13_1]
MISRSLRFEGFDSRSWTNLLSLFAPNVTGRLETEGMGDAPELDHPSPGEGRRGALVVVLDDRERVLKAFHTLRGRVVGLTYPGPDRLEELAHEWGALRCVVLREGVMEEIGERVAKRVERSDDYLAQWLVVARTVREMGEAGLLLTWPRPLGDVPIPTIGMVRRALDTVLPDGRAMVMVVWNGGSPWTGVVLRRSGGAIDLVAGPDLIARWTGPLGGDWRRDYRVISDAVARAVAPVHLGIFTDLTHVRDLLRSADPGAWARAVAVRDVIVHPTPPYVAVALGADAVRAFAQQSARWLGGLDALGQLAPLASYVRGRVAEVASVTATLGFDPLAVLAQWLRRAEEADAADREADRAPKDEAPDGGAPDGGAPGGETPEDEARQNR